MKKEYFEGIDFLKGCLIVLVITGHIIQGYIMITFSKYFIYSFHIPLFLGVSGFLLKENFIERSNTISLFNKYLRRMLIPYGIALPVYYFVYHLLPNFEVENISIENFIIELFLPYGHLWYITALFFYIIALNSLKKLNINTTLLLSIILISVAIIKNEIPVSEQNDIVEILREFLERYKPHYFIFFILGYYLRNIRFNPPSIINKISLLIFIISVIYRIISFHYPDKYFLSIDFYTLNISLIVITFLNIRRLNFSKANLINWIGRNSLPIYLWHLIVILVSKYLFLDKVNLSIWYLTTCMLIIIFIITIYGLGKITIVNTIVFGNIKMK